MEKKTNIVPCCIDCPNAGKWLKKYTEPAKILDNTCQKYLSCGCYNRWWFSQGREIDKGARLEVFTLRDFREMLKDLNEIKSSIEKQFKLNILQRTPIEDRINEFEDGTKRVFSVSEFYYHGPSNFLDWMIGIEMTGTEANYVYEKLYILSKDDVHKFKTKDEFMNFLIGKGILKKLEGEN